jgi:hypothetical protein
MPPGTTSSEFGHFMEVADWTKVSLTQTPPAGFTNGNGPLVNMSPYDMSRMKPVAVGGNAYQFVNDDGQWAMTVGLDNQPIRYTAGIDKATIDDAIKSPEPQPGPTPVQGPLGVTPGADQPSIMGVPQTGGGSRVAPPEGGLPVVPGSLAANPGAAAAFAAPAIAARGGSAGSPAPAPLSVATPVVPPTPNAPVVTPAPATPPQVPPVQQPSEGKLTEAEQAHVDDMMKLIMESSKRSNPNMTDAQRADYEKSLRDMMTRRELAGRGGEKPLKDLTGRTPLHRGGR